MTEFTIINHDSESTRIEDSRSAAEERKKTGINGFDFDPSDIEIVQGAYDTYSAACDALGDPGTPAAAKAEPATVEDENGV